MSKRMIGIDIGAETIKLVELEQQPNGLEWVDRAIREHNKEPIRVLNEMLSTRDWSSVGRAAVTGRLSRQVDLSRIPIKQAQLSGYKFLFGDRPATIVSIGSHGFSVLELRSSHMEMFRENSRCSQGTGNFLRQLVERFELSIEAASEMCAQVSDPAPLSGRCPVILKTDMTHLANKGEPQERILAGLYDAVCENVQVLIKPRTSPKNVVLLGGVSRSQRIRDHFERFAGRNEMTMMPTADDDALYFEALGCAVIAAEQPSDVPALDRLFSAPEDHPLDELPPLKSFLHKVKRLTNEDKPAPQKPGPLILGYDIGSTGSKVVALDVASGEGIWQGYINTNGMPVKAAQSLTQQFVDSPFCSWPVVAVGATGSGREIVGSLMNTCFGAQPVYVLNEIAAHAEGALHYDSRVDTIFEIGGQDAKYIRLAAGRVIDAAMNEACSAGTGSFIEEQGRKFSGIEDVKHLGREALAAQKGVSLGQHCSVFMAEVIDEAVASSVPQRAIIAGIYDSIIQNYLNRVKGSRSVGRVVFCQGMPFAADALASAVARQTGSDVIVPPDPGTVGALGIALLARKERRLDQQPPLDLNRFLAAKVLKKDVFICKSTKGCGGSGNHCRIDRISTMVDDKKQKFTWGGSCSLYDKGTGKKKLPDRSPNPFLEREALIREICDTLAPLRDKPKVAMTDEFVLKGLFPFFATFIHEMGFDTVFYTDADQAVLKRGIEDANVPFCAPMQQYHGLVSLMAADRPDYLFLPMVRNIPRVKDEEFAKLCPIIQGSADMLRWDLDEKNTAKIISPVVNFGKDNLRSELFKDSCRDLAGELGVDEATWLKAYQKSILVQEKFDHQCLKIGQRALAFCEEKEITPIVILGRVYTIYNTVLNSNVPALLREQGALPIPLDCYPLDDETPIFRDSYWGYGQRILRGAQKVRRTPRVYSLFCSNYSCGPDSFNSHFFSYLMEGKPFALIETDGHSGDAGTKTRIEAFLYCVHEDLQRQKNEKQNKIQTFKELQRENESVQRIIDEGTKLLIPRMGAGADAAAACLRGIGVQAESLPLPDREALALGRRHTSGKECIPMTLTLGSLLKYIQNGADPNQKIAFFMPTANGPCRFGSYNMLYRIIFDRLGLKDRVRIWSPVDTGYFDDVSDGFSALVFAGFLGSDLMSAMLYDVRPVETVEGKAQEIYEFYHDELIEMLEQAGTKEYPAGATVSQILSGRMFGVSALLQRAATAFKNIKSDREIPTILVVGELYVRCDPFANDFVIRKLEKRGIRSRFAAFNEWIEYTDYQDVKKHTFPEYFTSFLQATIQHHLSKVVGDILGWPDRLTIQDSLAAAKPYIREQLSGEAALTLGGPVYEWREGHIDGVVSTGPFECMPNKIAESQFFHVAEQEGLISLTLGLNGEPTNPELLDNFAYEVHQQFERRRSGKSVPPPPIRPRPPRWRPQSRVNSRE